LPRQLDDLERMNRAELAANLDHVEKTLADGAERARAGHGPRAEELRAAAVGRRSVPM